MSSIPSEQFTIVIVNYNGGSMLLRCVESVIASGVLPDKMVLVDNGSRDNSDNMLSAGFPAAKVILNDCNAGFARAANQGLAEANAKFGIVLNNDALISVETLSALAAAFSSDQFHKWRATK